MGLAMSEVQSVSGIGAAGAFGGVPFFRLAILLVVVDFVLAESILSYAKYDQVRFYSLLGFAIIFVLTIMIGRFLWWRNAQRRQRIVRELLPRVYQFTGKDQVWIELEGLEAFTEQEQISTYDQANIMLRMGSGMDMVLYTVLVLFILFPIAQDPTNWWTHISMIVLLVAFAIRWVYLGDGFIAGFNRIRIDPQGWEWGGWSRRFKKSGRWENARVLLRPATKHARIQMMVVIGDEESTIAIIVPRDSVDLILRAKVGNVIEE